MKRQPFKTRAYWIATGTFAAGALFQLSFIDGCNDKLVGLTNFIDPCGTILGNCQPGDFQISQSFVGDYCLDPACTVPGGCDNDDPPLGLQFDLCP